jgi:hypothetical protein
MSSGVAQISAFPDSAPSGESDLEVRIKHFTEIENFGFLGYVLAHELGGKAQHIQTLADLKVPDAEVQALVTTLRGRKLSDEELETSYSTPISIGSTLLPRPMKNLFLATRSRLRMRSCRLRLIR